MYIWSEFQESIRERGEAVFGDQMTENFSDLMDNKTQIQGLKWILSRKSKKKSAPRPL